jgi:hypothetical protein
MTMASPAAPLKTPTDLKSNAAKSVAEALNIILADSFALYLKTKNFHWHVSGPHFRDYHLRSPSGCARPAIPPCARSAISRAIRM